MFTDRYLEGVKLISTSGNMTDLFDKGDAASLLRDKTIILLGGSVIRGLYKDLVWLLNSNSLIDSGVIMKPQCSMQCQNKNQY